MNSQSIVNQLVGLMKSETGISVSLESVQAERAGIDQSIKFLCSASNANTKIAREFILGTELNYLLSVLGVSRSLEQKLSGRKRNIEIGVQIVTSHELQQVAAEQLSIAMDALADYLERLQGQIDEDLFYPGGYSISVGRTERGGVNYIESAQAKFNLYQW
jgi:hypothetical protein